MASTFAGAGRRAATYVQKILNGTPPGDLPGSSRPGLSWSSISGRKGARPHGPPTLLARADEVIE